MDESGWQKVVLSWLAVVRSKLIKMSLHLELSRWSSFVARSDICATSWTLYGVNNTGKVKVWRWVRRKGRICRWEWNVRFWYVSYMHNPRMREEAEEKGDGPTECTAGPSSCVRGEKSNLQEQTIDWHQRTLREDNQNFSSEQQLTFRSWLRLN